MDTAEMQIFDQALHGLIAKAAKARMRLSPEELARRMLIVQQARVDDPQEYERSVLAENFAEFEAKHRAKLDRTEIDLAGFLREARFDRLNRRILEGI